MSPRHNVYDSNVDKALLTLDDVELEVNPRSPYARVMERRLKQIADDRKNGVLWEDIAKAYFPPRARPNARTLRRLYAAFRKAGRIN